MRIFSAIFLFAIAAIVSANRHKNPNYVPGRSAMVHLFEWKWEDIASECERYLGPKGFGGVQVSSFSYFRVCDVSEKDKE